MSNYRVRVTFWSIDMEGQKYTDTETSWVDAASEAHAAFIVGSQQWGDEDLSHLVSVSAVLETN